ncbi:NPC intracellular cholesterol transporter 1 homolog 1b-like [Ostrinia nubilalis]|uniref:NPC intracellular cholesterol transporter 1 homolog 1b-like n=1 Tax=Ostrinia nubilalis TaxID=29057 RepID=UPI0030824AFB
MKPVLITVTLLFLLGQTSAKCVMRGECYSVGGFPQNCPVDEEAPPLVNGLSPEDAAEAVSIIRHRCPELATDENGEPIPDDQIRVCCALDQLRGMTESLLLADGVLGRCPICFRNFARQICEMNCSPDQSRFVTVYEGLGTNNTRYVNEVDYRMYQDFMDGAHASCAGVILPQTGTPAINMMCGNAPECTPEAWFGFTGDKSQNPLAPVQVNFLKWETPEDSMSVRAPPCNETLPGDLPCSCVDCFSTCPVGNEPVVTESCTVFLSVNCISFYVGIGFFALAILIFATLTVIEVRRTSKPSQSSGGNRITRVFQNIFAGIGAFSASHAVLVLMLTSWVGFGMIFGVFNLRLTSNPIELWSAPESRSRQELEYFNSRFGPFYRTSQVFLTVKLDPFTIFNNATNSSITYGPAFRFEAVQELIKLESDIKALTAGSVTLDQVCYAPLRMPGDKSDIDLCVTMSVATYFGEDAGNINNVTYLDTMMGCINNHFALNCMAPWGGGSEPELSLGGFEDNNVLSATTLTINLPLSNFLLEDDLVPVLEWEQRFLDFMHAYEANSKPDFIELAFAAERSIEDEIIRVSVAEAVPIAISYIIMFVYVIFALGHKRSFRTWLVDSKVLVAIGSILVVVTSIFCAMGMMGYLQITATLLAINVIPFFILSIGIDNVFLMINTLHEIESNLKSYDDYNENFDFEMKRKFVFSKMMGTVGPSIFVSSVTQITCFAIGSLANFPAVVTFAIFASFSLAFLFVFQITTVVAIVSLDYKRVSQKRLDVLFCVQKKVLDDTDPLHSETPHQGVTKRLMEPYANILLKPSIKIVVVIFFVALTSVSIILIPSIEIGLDQEMALPTDSYVYRYLQAVAELLQFGPPVYFVLKGGLNFTNVEHQNAICGGRLCNETSLITQIFLASLHSDITYVARSSNSWIDDFIDWTGLPGACCKYNTTDGSFCSSMDQSAECQFCEISRDEWAGGLRPSAEAFEKYIPFFLRDTPNEQCNRGGLASYFSAVNYLLDSEGRATVHDTNFMAYHNALASSQDYITAVKYGYEISANISTGIKELIGVEVEVFPYSIFYVFYEQYLTMWWDTFASIGYCLIGAVVFNLVASGFNFLTTFAVMFTAIMVVINMMGVMFIWNIPLNAVSCVNLIVSIGIAVEFCSHIAYAYSTSTEPSDERIKDALKRVGSTIITGITFTNIPIIVLAFSYTQIIEVFFFRMFFSVVILGFTHGMIFFPVFLCYLNNLTCRRS